MRILHITDNYGFTGGIQSYIKNVADLFVKNGHATQIYSPSENGENLGSYFSRWVSYSDYREVRNHIRHFKPDILHGHSVSMRISPSPFLAAKEKGIPVVMTVHDFGYVCPRKWMIYRDETPCRYGFGFRCLVANCAAGRKGWLYQPYHNLRWLKIALHRHLLRRYVGVFICPSEALAQWMRDSLKIRNVVAIPNFVESSPPRPERLQASHQLLFVGRLSEEKGVAGLLEAMPRVLKTCPDAFLTIVGDGPVRQKLESLSRSLKIGDHVIFAGMIENKNLERFYRHAAICVIPSLWMENCPVTALEALSFGKPLIGSSIGGIPALIQEGKTGFLFDRNDIKSLAEKIILLLEDRALLDSFSKNALSFFRQTFTSKKHYEQMISLYASLIKR
jgi:glycosyltransferase involved in cell wall biosynthesis